MHYRDRLHRKCYQQFQYRHIVQNIYTDTDKSVIGQFRPTISANWCAGWALVVTHLKVSTNTEGIIQAYMTLPGQQSFVKKTNLQISFDFTQLIFSNFMLYLSFHLYLFLIIKPHPPNIHLHAWHIKHLLLLSVASHLCQLLSYQFLAINPTSINLLPDPQSQ